ncbi:MAG TPA: hypothetical protein PK765_05750, partial [bacterium]|nr:hypothetical protein [bacterium]
RTAPSRPLVLFLVGVLVSMPFSSMSARAAVTVETAREQATSALDQAIAAYEARIKELETENARLKAEISVLKGSGSVSVPVVTAPSSASGSATTTGALNNNITISSTGSLSTLVITGDATLDTKYRTIIQKVQDNRELVLRSNEM